MMPRLRAACLAGLILAMPLPAMAATFAGDLDPVPHDNSMRDNVVGDGTVSANLSGKKLTITGHFAGLSSPATAAHLKMGVAMGVPGVTIGELAVTGAPGGDISGNAVLTAAEIAALQKGALYVELDSVKAADGNSWAWLQAAEEP